MLTRNCKLIIDSILSRDETQHFKAYSLRDLCKMTNLSFDNVLSACEELDRDKYATLRILHLPNGQEIRESITLTELGKNYKEKRSLDRKELLFKSVLIPVFVTLATNGILAALKWLWPHIQVLLFHISG